MEKKLPPKLEEYFLRVYSRQKSKNTLIEPVFITHKRLATVFVGSSFRDNLRLCRYLKNRGYTVTIRKKRIPNFKVFDRSTGRMLKFAWEARCNECFGRGWKN